MSSKKPKGIYSLIAVSVISTVGLLTAINFVTEEEKKRVADRARYSLLNDAEKQLLSMEQSASLVTSFMDAHKNNALQPYQCSPLNNLMSTVEYNKMVAKNNRDIISTFNFISPAQLANYQARIDKAYWTVKNNVPAMKEICANAFQPKAQIVQIQIETARPWYERAEIEFNPNK